MSDLIPQEDGREETPNGSYIEFLKDGNLRGCSCSAGCLQVFVLLALLGLALYMLFFR